jgi:uncharacterized SAM-binding protein YcdF (DUF218 family)
MWRRLAKSLVFVGLLAGAGIFVLGLADYQKQIATVRAPEPMPAADGVVALTGGSRERLTFAMDILEAGGAREMLVSGVNDAVPDDDVAALLNGPAALIKDKVEFGKSAADTVGNARETAEWARRHQLKTIIVVTDDYHMPRALLELRTRVREAELIAAPVPTGYVHRDSTSASLEGTKRLVTEYSKYLIVQGREFLLSLGGGRDEDEGPVSS